MADSLNWTNEHEEMALAYHGASTAGKKRAIRANMVRLREAHGGGDTFPRLVNQAEARRASREKAKLRELLPQYSL